MADDTSSNETGSAETPADETEHYFSADPSVPFKRAPVRAEVWGHDLSLASLEHTLPCLQALVRRTLQCLSDPQWQRRCGHYHR